jgi:hypothetical protein
MAIVSGCQWDPPHDNPLDPGSNAYHFPFGSSKVTIQTLVGQPIKDATVLLPELGQFGVTDSNGVTLFEELPIGKWWVVAFRDNIGYDVYARDSAQLTVSINESSELTLPLDGLPKIITAYAISVAFIDTLQQYDPIYSIRLKSTILDPDGAHHLQRVEAVFIDTLHGVNLELGLQYNADSAYWWQDVPADSFHNNSTDNAIILPFTFRAFDVLGHISPPRTAFVARVLHNVPSLISPTTEMRPHLSWLFSYLSEFKDTSTFNYHVIIYSSSPPFAEVYRRVVVPDNSASISHTVDTQLPVGEYIWEVLVIDNFGNSSRSMRDKLTVGVLIND